jgi:probable HAF family extracellular repeat protein
MEEKPTPNRLLLLAFYLGSSAALQAAAQTYEIRDLGPLPGGASSQARAIGPSGLIAGDATNASSIKHAVLWDGGAPMDLGAPDGFIVSGVLAINAAGEVAGHVYSDASGYLAYSWSGGTWTGLPNLPNRMQAIARGINADGLVVGESFTPGRRDGAAVLWDAGEAVDLGNFGGRAKAQAINDAGQVTGSSTILLPNGAEESRAFLWQDGVMTDLGVLAGEDYSEGLGLNGLGDVAGSSWHVDLATFASVTQATLWVDGEPLHLGGVPAPFGSCQDNEGNYPASVASDVNDCGQVVGHAGCVSSGAAVAAFLWEGERMQNLNDLVSPSTGWDLLSAVGIDSKGKIVGHGIAPGGELHGFLALPLPQDPLEPSAIDLRSDAEPLRVERSRDEPNLLITWEDLGEGRLYALSAGLLGEWYSHEALTCGLGIAMTLVEELAGESRYFVAAEAACNLGPMSVGRDSFGAERPAAVGSCP